jgi:hypothetical protein
MTDRPVLIVVADLGDQAAQALVERWAAWDARLLTPQDLSQVGWSFRPDKPQDSRVVASGNCLAGEDIRGVLTRLLCVTEQSLSWIAPVDRAYVAAEMNALLLAWLSELPCRVLNRATPGCLAGPFWRQERWVSTAARLGIPVRPFRRGAHPLSDQSARPSPKTGTVTVVGTRCVGDVAAQLGAQARALARVAGADLLTVRFDDNVDGARFLDARVWPDTICPELADALLDYLTGAST